MITTIQASVHLIFLIQLSINSFDAIAQTDQSRLDFITKENGLLSNDVYSIVQDNDGIGIVQEALDHIFKPFYTLDANNGSGLEPNIVYNIVKQKLDGLNCMHK